jgi:hypothetical protein
MTTVSLAGVTTSTQRRAAWFAVASGLAGLLSFGCLLSYLLIPGLLMDESGAIPRAGRILLDIDFLAAMLQALLLLPLAGRIARVTQQSPIVWIIGVAGMSLVALCRVLPIFKLTVSDILFMLPTGLVGIWLLFTSRRLQGIIAKAVAVLGMVAGVFLAGVTLNFVFNGGLAVFTQGPFAYGPNVPFHIGLALTGAPGFTLFPLWSILVGMQFLKISRKSG